MAKFQVKIIEPKGFSEQAIAMLEKYANVDSSGDINSNTTAAEAIFIRLSHQIDGHFLRHFSSLKYVVSPTTGEDHIDKDYLNHRGIRLFTLKGERRFLETIPATAEFTWGLVLSLSRNIPAASGAVRAGNWDRDAYKGTDLCGKTIALVGFGRVAKIVARYAAAFGMHVKVYDPYITENTIRAEIQARGVEFCDTLLSLADGADVLTIHASLTPETMNLIDSAVLNKLPKHAFLINTSRGDIVDSRALLSALESGELKAAAIDVLPGERNPSELRNSELLEYAKKHDNLLITPHLAGATHESMASTEEFMVAKLLENIGFETI